LSAKSVDRPLVIEYYIKAPREKGVQNTKFDGRKKVEKTVKESGIPLDLSIGI